MCSVEDCNNKVFGHGYCNKHWQQIRKYGEIRKYTLRTFNEVIDKGSYVELVLTDKNMNEVGRAKIDKEDLNKVKMYGRWTLSGQGYVHNGKNKVLLHRVVMNAETHEDIDHIKTGIKYRSDNRKSKLRRCTTQQNSFNQGKRRNNTSGYKGVYRHTQNGCWIARIQIGTKVRHLGCFQTAKAASNAYEAAAKKYHKEFYYLKTGGGHV